MKNQSILQLILTLALAFLLEIFLRSFNSWNYHIPPFVLLAILFKLFITRKFRIHYIWLLFFFGIIFDIVFDNIMGIHALLFNLILLAAFRIRYVFVGYSEYQQAFAIFLLMILYRLMHYISFFPNLIGSEIYQYWYMPIYVAALWMLLIILPRHFEFFSSN